MDDGGVAGGEEGADHGGRHVWPITRYVAVGLSSAVILVARRRREAFV